MRHDSEGFIRSNNSGLNDLDGYLANKLESSLRSGVIHPKTTETSKRLLAFVERNPGCTADECAAGVGVGKVWAELNNFCAIGYMEKTPAVKERRKTIKEETYRILQKGVSAIYRKELTFQERMRAVEQSTSKYEVYVPPVQQCLRVGQWMRQNLKA